MIKFVVCNQRGGVGKTTTTQALARYFSDQGLRTLMIDTDPQGSLGLTLSLPRKMSLRDLLIDGVNFDECKVVISETLHLIASNRDTAKADIELTQRPAGELAMIRAMKPVDLAYEAIVIDAPPSVNLIQACSMAYTGQVLLPVSMDMISMYGLMSTTESVKSLCDYMQIDIRLLGVLPTMVDRRLALTTQVMNVLEEWCEKQGVTLLPTIRTDSSVGKSQRVRSFLVDYDPKCRAWEDYQAVGRKIMEILDVQSTAQTQTTA